MSTRDIEQEALDLMDAVSGWIAIAMELIGESPEAMRGAEALGEVIVNLCNTIKEQIDPGKGQLMITTQLFGVVALVAGVAEKIKEVTP